MTSRKTIQEIPDAVRLTLEKARAEFRDVIRKIRWSEGPILICGTGSMHTLAATASHSFEAILGWPVIARPIEIFHTYSTSLLKPRAVLIIVSARGEWPEAEELARLAHGRGCIVVLLTNTPESELAKLAHHVLLSRAEGEAESPVATVCLHAALNLFVLELAMSLKRPDPHWTKLSKEFTELPQKLEWMFTQFTTVVRSAAEQALALKKLRFVGGGYYEFPARRAASELAQLRVPRVDFASVNDVLHLDSKVIGPHEGFVFCSGANSRIKKLVCKAADDVRARKCLILSITDGSDRELLDKSEIGILLPSLMELTSSSQTLFLLEWLSTEMVRVPAA